MRILFRLLLRAGLYNNVIVRYRECKYIIIARTSKVIKGSSTNLINIEIIDDRPDFLDRDSLLPSTRREPLRRFGQIRIFAIRTNRFIVSDI